MSEKRLTRPVWWTPAWVAGVFAAASVAWILWSDAALRGLRLPAEVEARVEGAKGAGFALVSAGALFCVLLQLERLRRRSAAAHEAMEARLGLILSTTTSGFYDWDIAAGTVWRSEEYRKFLGIGAYATLDSWRRAVHPEDLARAEGELDGAFKGGATEWRASYRVRRADGVFVRIDDRAVIVRDLAGRAVRMAGSFVDVSERVRMEGALARSEELYRAVVEAQTEMIVRWDPDGTMTFANEAAKRVFGGELLGRKWQEALIPAEFRAEMEGYRREVVENARPGRVRLVRENPMSLAGGEVRQFQWINTPMFDEGGRLREVLSVGRDITERVEAERALEEREERLRLVAGATSDALWDWDLKEGTLWWSDGLRSAFGYGAGSFEPMLAWWEACLHPEDRARVAAGLQAAVDQQRSHWADTYRFLRADGTYADVADRGRVLFDVSGRAVRMVGGMVDVTERTRTERRLAESEERYRALVEQSPLALMLHDAGTLVYLNPAAARMLGAKDGAELVGTSVFDRIHAEFREIARGRVATAISAGKTPPMQQRWVRLDGGEIDVEVVGSRVSRAGRPLVQVLVLDVSERHAAERRQALLMRELDHRVKNNLATVLAISERSAATAESVDGFRRSLRGRIESLARAHDLLRRSRWESVGLRELTLQIMAPFAEGARLQLQGEDMRLGAPVATALAMTLHELATNAAKHGALSVQGGSVRLEAQRSVGGDGREGVRLVWTEEGGPAVSPPTRRGFGTSMMEGMIRHELGGTVKLEYAPQGVRCEVWAPLEDGAQRTAASAAAGGV